MTLSVSCPAGSYFTTINDCDSCTPCEAGYVCSQSIKSECGPSARACVCACLARFLLVLLFLSVCSSWQDERFFLSVSITKFSFVFPSTVFVCRSFLLLPLQLHAAVTRAGRLLQLRRHQREHALWPAGLSSRPVPPPPPPFAQLWTSLVIYSSPL